MRNDWDIWDTLQLVAALCAVAVAVVMVLAR